MIEFLDQISKGIEANLYYLALFASLSIPDICGALGSENGKSRRDKYINWFNENVGNPKNYNLSGKTVITSGVQCFTKVKLRMTEVVSRE
ncbi:hypothetical protein PGH42_05345 [Legionella pneumophila]|nr:hypothetical protein PGH42_05345 [Legionella pneumophila]